MKILFHGFGEDYRVTYRIIYELMFEYANIDIRR